MKDFIEKIWWRVRFVIIDMWGMDPRIITYTLFPFVRKRVYARETILSEHGLLWNEKRKRFEVNGFVFSYKGEIPTGDIVSIHLSNDPYIQRNFIENRAFRLEGPYERGGAQIQSSDVVVDVGANIGLFSVLAGEKTGEKGKVFAFEPVPDAQEILKENLKINNTHNVEIVPCALGSKNKTLELSVDIHDLGASSAVLTQGKGKKVTVSQITLDDFVKEHGINRVDFIKVDIEGMERELLKGAQETIKRFKPKLAICIYHRPDDPQVIEALVRDAVSQYRIEKTKTKLYAWI